MRTPTKLTLLALAVTAFPSWAGETRRDGNYWNTLDESTKLTYIVGVYEGMVLGSRFSTWKYLDSKDVSKAACTHQAVESYNEYAKKYTSNVTNGQIADGLNAFYADYQNRQIELPGAIWVVVKGIAGTPQKEMDALIENSRKSATD